MVSHFLDVILLIAAAVVFVFAPLTICLFHIMMLHRRRNRYYNRTIISFQDWIQLYYRDAALSPDHIRTILQLFANEIGVYPTQLSPSDRLYEDLSLPWVDVLDDSWDHWRRVLPTMMTNVLADPADDS